MHHKKRLIATARLIKGASICILGLRQLFFEDGADHRLTDDAFDNNIVRSIGTKRKTRIKLLHITRDSEGMPIPLPQATVI